MDKQLNENNNSNTGFLRCEGKTQLENQASYDSCLQTHAFEKHRNSSIELFKIIAILMIVLFHTVHTLTENQSLLFGSQESAIHLDASTNNVQQLILSMISYFGNIGNTVFFVCSAWFLIRQDHCKKNKIMQMILDIWIISVSVLFLFACIHPEVLAGNIVLKMLFPSLFSTNWYLTCYMIFFVISPFLNLIIQKVNQKTLLRIAISLFLLYSVGGLLHGYLCRFIIVDRFFFPSDLIVWTMIYFVIAYVQLYLPGFAANRRYNGILAIASFFVLFGSMVLRNTLGLHIPLFDSLLLAGNTSCNPFMLFMIISLFNLFRSYDFHSKLINYISRLSLFIYIIHENLLLRKFCRPQLWKYFINRFGAHQLLPIALTLTVLIFLASLLASVFYYHTVHKLVVKLCKKAYPKIVSIAQSIEAKLLRIS